MENSDAGEATSEDGNSEAPAEANDTEETVGLTADTPLDADADTTEGAGEEELNLETGSPLSEWSLWRGIGAVFIVLGLVLVAAWLIRKLRSGSGGLTEGSGLAIKEAIGLGGGKRVMILQTRDEELILGVTDERISLLSRQPRGYAGPEEDILDSGEWRDLEEEERRLAEEDGWEPDRRSESRRWRSSQVLSEQEIYGEDAGGSATGVEVEGEEDLGHAGKRFLSELRDKLDEWEP